MSSPYTIPYKATTSAFVPGAAAHPPAPQDYAAMNMRTVRQPAVTGQPVAADTSRSNGPVVVGGAPRDAIPARFSSAVAAAAGGGIAIATLGGLQGVSGPASAGAANSSGQSGQVGEVVHTSTTTTTTPFGTDGCHEMEQQLQAIQAENAQLKAEKQQLRDNLDKMGDAISTAGLAFEENVRLRDDILRLNKALQHTATQSENLFRQVSDFQDVALVLNRDRDRLQIKNRLLRAELRHTIKTLLGLDSENLKLKGKVQDATMSVQILIDVLAAFYNKTIDNVPEILSTLSERVKKTVDHVYEEWKEEQYLQMLDPYQAMQISPYDLVPGHTPVPSHGGIEFIPLDGDEELDGEEESQSTDETQHDDNQNGIPGPPTAMPTGQPQQQQPLQQQALPHIPNHNTAIPHANIYLPGQASVFRLIIDSPGQPSYEHRILGVESPHTPTTGGPAPPSGGTINLSDNLYDPDTPTHTGTTNTVNDHEDPQTPNNGGTTITNVDPENHEDSQTPQTPTPLRHHGVSVLGTPDA
ncbi:hypothetical protein BDP81DRAFT_396053 [Colletotrichum phormii]|uniref:Uncharacterized protein n=1 Tax=Colletotrichum phormii TaxID=359342 RepID=A0AAI9ZMM9_9PEZI|nr:uncharacterized protein BDP81DRAFT_396053 [Colletotrichum phormii]KAK1634801.1 hypothetical protein BDP81DRAFT_396053 [Colletotrichum phormii]